MKKTSHKLPYLDVPESIEQLAIDFVRLRSISGNSIPATMNFLLSGQPFSLSIHVCKDFDGDILYKVSLLQLTVGEKEDISDLIGLWVINNQYEVDSFGSSFNNDYYSDITLLLLENLEKYYFSKSKLQKV